MTNHAGLPGSSVFGGIAAAVHQWRFPSALRIAPVRQPQRDAVPADLEQAWRQLTRALKTPNPAGAGIDPGLLRALVTTLWKLEGLVARMTVANENRPLRNRMRELGNLLRTHQIQVYDYSGRPYDPDELWDDVVSDESCKIDPVIVAMREPRIVYRGDMLQRGIPVVEDRASGGESK